MPPVRRCGEAMYSQAKAYVSRTVVTGLVGLIWFYKRVVSPWLRPSCRFPITCSQYAVHVLRRDGVIKGCARAFKRFVQCNPWVSVERVSAAEQRDDERCRERYKRQHKEQHELR